MAQTQEQIGNTKFATDVINGKRKWYVNGVPVRHDVYLNNLTREVAERMNRQAQTKAEG